MFRIRTKTQMTVVGMTIITLVLILFRISASDEVSPAFEKERDHSMQTSHSLVHKLEDISEVSSMTQSPKHIAKQKESEARIMADIRVRSQDDRIGRKLMLPNEKVHIMSNLDAENNDIKWSENKLFSGDRIVHLDLKGAPPKISYFEELFPLFRKLGATGLLIEYEDMFPYNGTLQDIPAYNAYSRSDIKQILHLAKINMLEVIPLIQTFGHMEFILKLEKYSYLREVSTYPQVICPSHNSTFPLITAMIDQIMELHPDIKNLHIGCDEVYYLGLCVRCAMAMIDNKWSRSQLFLNHVVRVAKYIRKYYPSVMPLTWDDEFRSLSTTELLEFEVPRWLEPVVWKYSPDLGTTMASEVWENYVTVFPNIWIASAFKGATGPDRYVTDISYHLDNHRAWMDIVATYGNKINFRGLMLTGWQRYDHFAILCELLPVGLPSLATNLVYVQSNNRDMTLIPHKVLDILKCDPPLPMSPGMGRSRCSFPGAGVLEAAERLYSLQQNLDRYLSDSTAKGWFTPYNIDHSFSNPSHVEHATAELDRCKMELLYIERDMTTAMAVVYDHYTASEWIETYIRPLDTKIRSLWEAKEKLLAKNHWPRRPLDASLQAHERTSSKSRTRETL
ncbi:hexosaminidase D [Anabrus simplex]|uniref:hexosaminidase D n=1 Tax=Anabrus simplex TaxID=316456 RepID=UPI0035A3CC3B